MQLNIFAEIDAVFEQVGQIVTKQAVGGVFSYCDSWIENHPNFPLSFSLPLSANEFKGRQIKPYFAGLLPEGQALTEISNRLHVSSESYLKILSALGDECIGAVRILNVERELESNNPCYEELPKADIEKIASSTYPKSAQVNTNAKLSIAGAQAKVGLFIDPETGKLFIPKNSAPSNWIAKPASSRFENLIDNEFYCMKLAKCCGLSVAECRVSNTEKPMLLIKRFDRILDTSRAKIDDHATFARLHQEDFSQALGIISAKKYESQHSYYARKSSELLRAICTDAVGSLKAFFELVLFNFLIGNCDAHLKNYSILRSEDWHTLNLAPAYDLASTAVYTELSTSLAMHIGAAKKLDNVTRESIIQFGADLSLTRRMTVSLLDDFCDQFRRGIECCECTSKVAEKIKAESIQRLEKLK